MSDPCCIALIVGGVIALIIVGVRRLLGEKQPRDRD